MTIRRTTLLSILIATVFMALPFQWITIVQIGPLSIKPVHLPLCFLTLFSPLLVTRHAWAAMFRGDAALFLLLSSIVWLWTFVSVAWTAETRPALTAVVKSGIHLAFFFTAAVAATSLILANKWQRPLAVGVALGACLYLSYNVLLFARLGHNVFLEYFQALVNLDIVRLRFWFSQRLFNCSLAGSCQNFHGPDAELLSASLTNTVAAALVTYTALALFLSQWFLNRWVRSTLWLAGSISAFFVLASMSRSNTVALLLVVLLASLITNHNRHPTSSRFHSMLLGATPYLFAILGIGLVSDVALRLIDAIALRMADVSTDPRQVMYFNAFAAIADAPFLGHGEGKTVLDGAGVAYPVHNIFLAAWLEQGVLGLLFVGTWYLFLCMLVIKAYANRQHLEHHLLTKWAALLPIVGLIRSLVGSGGNFTLIEWMATAIFIGFTSARYHLARDAHALISATCRTVGKQSSSSHGVGSLGRF
jgi:hypothetical protein